MISSPSTTGHVMTLANSIIGVAILAMPFCFQKCGILLSVVLLVAISTVTRVCCHYLVKSSILCRRRCMEIMALYVFGPSGKLMVELCTIGYLMGTCVAYFVVVGDLGPQIISKMFAVERTDGLRVWTMLLLTAVCVIPLGLLRNVDSLSVVCTASIGFYFCLVFKVMFEARQELVAGDWLHEVHWWRWSGVLQCLPIFGLSLSCQIVIFEVFETVPNATLSRMNDIVKSAVSLCTCVYVAVGSFGYIAFFRQEFSGNVLLNLESSASADIIQLGFVLSVACSFPLVIFPCRASLYSLLYQRDHAEGVQYIPEHRFRGLTLAIIVPALVVGILTPSVELIIGLVGSTIGVAICIMFPASCFIRLGKRDSSEVLLAKFLLVFGFLLMVLGTYANLEAFEDKTSGLQTAGGEVHLHNANDLPIIDTIIAGERVAKSHVYREPFVPKKTPKSEHMSSKPPRIVELESIVGQHVESIRLHPPTDVPKAAAVQRKPDPDINQEAIAHEEHEIAIEEKSKIDEQLGEIKKTKELVQEIKEQLTKQNEKTQQLVLEKFEQIVDKVEHIEKVQEESVAKIVEPKAMVDPVREQREASNVDQPAPSKGSALPVPIVAIPTEARKDTKTIDPIVQLLQKAQYEPISAANASLLVAPSNSSAAEPAIAFVDNVKEIALQSVHDQPIVASTTHNTTKAPKAEKFGRDVLSVVDD